MPTSFCSRIEAEARRVGDEGELRFLIANETVSSPRRGRIFVLSVPKGAFKVETVSSIGAVDRNAPRIRFIEGLVRQLAREAGLAKIKAFTLPAYCPPGGSNRTAPVPIHGLGAVSTARRPYLRRHASGTRDALAERDLLVAERLAETYSHAWRALSGPRRLKRKLPIKPLLVHRHLAGTGAMFIPVHMTVLAPSRIRSVLCGMLRRPRSTARSRNPRQPERERGKGTAALQARRYRASKQAARRRWDVKVGSGAADADQSARDCRPGSAARSGGDQEQTEVSPGQAGLRHRHAGAHRVKAETDGVVIFTDKRDWIGRPVSIGERVMEVADPNAFSCASTRAGRRRDRGRERCGCRCISRSDPLRPVAAKALSSSFSPQMIEGNMSRLSHLCRL